MQNHTEKIKKVFSFYYLIRTNQISSKVIRGWRYTKRFPQQKSFWRSRHQKFQKTKREEILKVTNTKFD
jgi:hypothetical protein